MQLEMTMQMRKNIARLFTDKELRHMEWLSRGKHVGRWAAVGGVLFLLLAAVGDVCALVMIARGFGLSGEDVMNAAFGPLSDPAGKCHGYQFLLYRHFLRGLIEIGGAAGLLVLYLVASKERRIISKFLQVTAAEDGQVEGEAEVDG
jgi:hypothetical protein